MKKRKMSGKLSTTYAILVVILVGIASIMFYEYNRDIIYNEGISNLDQVSTSAVTQLDNRLTSMEQVAVDVLTDTVFMSNWQEYIGQQVKSPDNVLAIKRILTKAYANKSDIRRVAVFSLEGDYIATGEVNAEKEDVAQKITHLQENYDINNRMFISSHRDDWDTNSETYVISEIKPIKNRQAEIIGFIEIQQNIFYLENICNLQYNNSKLKVLIFNYSDDKLFYSNSYLDEDYIENIAALTREYRKIRETSDAILATKSSNFYQMQMVFILDKSTLYNSLNNIVQGIVVGAVALILLTISYIILVTYRIMQPINHLVRRMQNIDFDNLNYNENFNYSKHKIKDWETEILINAFEEMVERLKEAQHRQQRLQNLHTKSIFDILQSEISPHFLYNALGGIANLCEDNESAAAAEACYSLTEILRYSSNYATTEVTVFDEIQNLICYINVMKSRYCERLEIGIETDNNAHHFILPKLTYQPIVENAIKYGLMDNEMVRIDISTKVIDNILIIQVDDNGREISKEAIEAIEEKVQKLLSTEEDICREVQFGGMGLGGTVVRLTIFFGDRFKYVIKGNENGGTTVRFEIDYN
ncbi:MAG TPA: histidine kinase [Clostridiaceae bacterium]|nr:histidine kinase [Clostridiaceae bacterium]